jgi:hypothetical protein
MPDNNTNKFSITLTVEEDTSQKLPHQQLNPLKPMKLTYERSGQEFQLIQQE